MQLQARKFRPRPSEPADNRHLNLGTGVDVAAAGGKSKAGTGVKPKAKANDAMMLSVLQQFRVVVRAVRTHYDRVERRSGLSGAQLWALARIDEQPGLKVGELARALAIHQSTASNMLERLVALGLVSKRRPGGDQRVVTVFATARGKAALKSAPQPLIGVLQQALCDMQPGALRDLHRHLETVLQAMRVRNRAGARSTPLSDM